MTFMLLFVCFFNKISLKHKLHLSRLFSGNHTCYCANMVSVTSASRYHPRYQSRSSMNICGLIPRNVTELAEAVPIGDSSSLYHRKYLICDWSLHMLIERVL